MPSTFSLAPSPKWYFFDSFGQLAVGGTLETFSSLDHSTPKFVFSDPAGLFPYDDPIQLDGTGGTPVPMYWESNGVDLYYVVIRDAPGNIILTIDNFPTPGGGVTPITTNVDIENHLINGQFLFIDAINETGSLMSPAPIGQTRIAPGSGFYKDPTGNYTPLLDAGWIFQKSGGAGVTDSIQFVPVAAIGVGFPNEPSANATRYFRYQFSNIGAPVTDAGIINVVPNVERFSGETITVSFDSRTNVIGAQGVFIFGQFFGTGGGSPVASSSQTFTFSSGGFARQSFTFIVPSVVGKNKGSDLNDHIFLEWQFPLNTIGTFELANFQVQRGVFGLMSYIQQTYAQDQYKILIDLIYNGNIIFRTGELKWMSNAPGGSPINIPGWLPITDVNMAFIGSAASGALHSGSDFQNLYMAWWNTFPQTEVIVFGGRGGSALADFNANKTMTPPRHILSTVLSGAGNGLFGNMGFGQFEGERTHVLTIPEMPNHTHTTTASPITAVGSGGNPTTAPLAVNGSLTGATGGGGPHNNMQPTFYLWLYVKL
jgi:hypothetical protein